MESTIVVHGGAGAWDVSVERLDKAVAACVAAIQAGQAILRSGGPALDSVEAAVRVLEDSPVLDAGRGSYLNAAGQIEMDALIMDGANMELGAIAAVQGVMNPISLARLVMTNSHHNFLVGKGAEAFANTHEFPRCALSDLLTEDQLALFNQLTGEVNDNSRDIDLHPEQLGDTVGAVALDQAGNLAAATSTGGTPRKQPGRVGDSPLVGSGAYADNWTAAVSATGDGEALMKVLVSKQVCDYIADGLSTQKACEASIDILKDRVNGKGGLIAVDIRGRIGIAYNTEAMPHAYALANEDIVYGH